MESEKCCNRLLGEISEEEFIQFYWRQKPLHIKNGFPNFISTIINEAKFDLFISEIINADVKGIHNKEGEVIFIENISRWIPELQVEADYYASMFGVPLAWFDAVRTHTASGIGSHFDHSDNFVLQQTGKKIWNLTSPDFLPIEDKAKRMLNILEVGTAQINPSNVISFELEAGDILYIPLFWIHSGLSTGNSLSLSLVCPAVSFQTLLVSSIHKIMREKLLGHQPVPTLPKCFTIEERKNYLVKLRKVSNTLLNHLSSSNIFDSLIDSQLDYLGVKEFKSVTDEKINEK